MQLPWSPSVSPSCRCWSSARTDWLPPNPTVSDLIPPEPTGTDCYRPQPQLSAWPLKYWGLGASKRTNDRISAYLLGFWLEGSRYCVGRRLTMRRIGLSLLGRSLLVSLISGGCCFLAASTECFIVWRLIGCPWGYFKLELEVGFSGGDLCFWFYGFFSLVEETLPSILGCF